MLFLAMAFSITWLLWLLPTGDVGEAAATFAPTVAALVVAARQGGTQGMLAQLRRFVQFRAPVSSYALAFFLLPGLLFCAFAALGYTPDKGSLSDAVIGIVLAARLNYGLGVLIYATFGPQGEELCSPGSRPHSARTACSGWRQWTWQPSEPR